MILCFASCFSALAIQRDECRRAATKSETGCCWERLNVSGPLMGKPLLTGCKENKKKPCVEMCPTVLTNSHQTKLRRRALCRVKPTRQFKAWRGQNFYRRSAVTRAGRGGGRGPCSLGVRHTGGERVRGRWNMNTFLMPCEGMPEATLVTACVTFLQDVCPSAPDITDEKRVSVRLDQSDLFQYIFCISQQAVSTRRMAAPQHLTNG